MQTSFFYIFCLPSIRLEAFQFATVGFMSVVFLIVLFLQKPVLLISSFQKSMPWIEVFLYGYVSTSLFLLDFFIKFLLSKGTYLLFSSLLCCPFLTENSFPHPLYAGPSDVHMLCPILLLSELFVFPEVSWLPPISAVKPIPAVTPQICAARVFCSGNQIKLPASLLLLAAIKIPWQPTHTMTK